MSTAVAHGKHRAAPPRARRRRSLVTTLVVTLLILAAGGGAAFRLLRPSPRHVPTAAENARAAALVDRLPVPAGATRDVTATACGFATRYCVSTPTLTYTELFDGALSDLKGLGAHVGSRTCDPAKVLRGQCAAELTYQGGGITVAAGDRSAQGLTVTSWLAVSGAGDAAPSARTPLGADWRSLGVVPPGWNGKLTCSEQTAAGCTSYRGTFLQQSTPQAARQTLQTQLDTAGYRVEQAGTLQSPLVASRFRGAGGSDRVTVVASVRASGSDFTQVTINVSAA